MKSSHALFVALLSTTALTAQSASEAPAEPAASASSNCVKTMKPHDHAAERSTGSSVSKAGRDGCGAAASPPAAKAKPVPAHDHGKTHEQQ